MNVNKGDTLDPKGLIYESFRIDGITKAECRSIFLDWALSLPLEQDTNAALQGLQARYGDAHPGHPMLDVLTEGRAGMAAPRRRGGWRSRSRN